MNLWDMIDVYDEVVPDFLERYLSSKEMQRLQSVDMNCGVNYTSFPFFKDLNPYSRYNHSIGTALITWHFTRDEAQILAALFHDIATPAFAHTIDFAYGDHEKQIATENRTAAIISSSVEIVAELKKNHIPIEAVSDYHQYPVADQDIPHLCADRVEYITGDSLDYGFAKQDELKDLFSDMLVAPNEDGQMEIQFKHSEKAVRFARLSLQCGKVYCSAADRCAMEVLARLIRKAVKENILTIDDLYVDEPHVINILENSALRKEWMAYRAMNHIETRNSPLDDTWLMIPAKKRYTNPLVKDKGRVDTFDRTFQKELHEFLDQDFTKVYIHGEE